MISSPDEPGVVTGPRLVTGPLHSISKLQLAPTDTGVAKRNKAFGMLKKSDTTKSVTLKCAVPLPRETGGFAATGTVQNNPLG